MSPDSLRKALEQSLIDAFDPSFRLTGLLPVSGGCINTAYRLQGVAAAEHVAFFVKTNRAGLLDMFVAEAEGLQELWQAGAVRVPKPVCRRAADDRSWLITEFIRFGERGQESDRQFGEQLAAQHRHQAGRFGWHRDNTIGSTPQPNGWTDSWAEFLRRHRLGFQLELAARNGFNGSLQHKGERLLAAVDLLFSGYTPVPSLLHGDLWGGNYAFDTAGRPVIFDPAVYYGDREADLAMTELFGGFNREFHAAYRAAWPLDAGYEVRKLLYNLYHILNHANLFGGGYAARAESMMDRLLAEL